MKVIEIENLSMEYKSNWSFRKKLALDKLSLSVEKGEVFGYLGANGSGKTTTIKILMSLLYATGGKAKVLGLDIGDSKCREKVGFLPENPYFYEYLTPVESLIFYGKLQNIPVETIKERTEELLGLVDLQHARDLRMIEFSKGMRQRFGLCQTLVNDPDLLILDEPLSGLDPMGRKLVKDIILDQKKKGKTVFFSSHILSDVEELCDRVAILVKGKLKTNGLVHELVSEAFSGFELQLTQINDQVKETIEGMASKIRLIGEDQIRCMIPPPPDMDQLLRKLQDQGAKIQAVIPEKETLEEFFVRISKIESVESAP